MLHLDACRGRNHDRKQTNYLISLLPDLLEGNVKGVMKVILSIAERYQPKSVKPRTVPEPPRPANHTAPLPDAQYGVRQELIRPYTHPQTPSRPEYGGQSLSQPASFHPSSLYPSPYPVDPAQEGMYSSPIDTLPANKPPQVSVWLMADATMTGETDSLSGDFCQEEACTSNNEGTNWFGGHDWDVWNTRGGVRGVGGASGCGQGGGEGGTCG